MKRFGIFFLLMTALAWVPAHAGMGVGLYVNQSSVAGSLMVDMDTGHGFMALGGEGIYKDDDYKMAAATLAVKNDQFMPGIRYIVGFKGYYIDAEHGKFKGSSTATGLAFLFGMGYELDAAINPLPIPVSIDGQLMGSPKPLTWKDGDYYWEARGGLGFHVLKNATIRVDLRRITASFEDKGYKWSKDDYNILLGYEIRF
ncbi:YfaZ precursor [Desulfobotulus alkaliphilus]|uniref:YfaZ n=1 Tax=Desulfobotulus alkaliphilus TaxID=622671 RepID=A0A562S3I2_9BACT|nr:YfaZ family outer membrane protein [Desulfobotulus alkaliphilus]TWI75334.1 YfaZ precursor [Desulfobotulus alkaliphilus]